jgi:hypothetical protein
MKNQDQMKKYQRWREVFGTEPGKLVLAEICRICGYDYHGINTDINGMVDPSMLAVNAGKRSVYLEIKKNLTEPKDLPEKTDEG